MLFSQQGLKVQSIKTVWCVASREFENIDDQCTSLSHKKRPKFEVISNLYKFSEIARGNVYIWHNVTTLSTRN